MPGPRGLLLSSAAALLAAAALLGAPAPASAEGEAAGGGPPERIVSLNPSLTAILLALGAEEALVGVDDFSAQQQEAVADLPRVGGLFDPSLEAVVALEPDLVVLVPSEAQRDFRGRLRELGLPVLALDPVRFDEVLETIEALGARTGRAEAAQARVEAIRAARRRVEEAVEGLATPRALLVLQRDPLFVVGAGSFVAEMLRMAGAENLGAELGDPYPRVSREWLLAAEPEVLLDASRGEETAPAYWARWPSLPAVQEGRVVAIPEGRVTLPGPWLDRALLSLARAVHGEALGEALGGGDATGAPSATDDAAASAAGADGTGAAPSGPQPEAERTRPRARAPHGAAPASDGGRAAAREPAP